MRTSLHHCSLEIIRLVVRDLFTGKESELNTSNSSTKKSENEPPKYYSISDENPILDQIASGNMAGFQDAIKVIPIGSFMLFI